MTFVALTKHDGGTSAMLNRRYARTATPVNASRTTGAEAIIAATSNVRAIF